MREHFCEHNTQFHCNQTTDLCKQIIFQIFNEFHQNTQKIPLFMNRSCFFEQTLQTICNLLLKMRAMISNYFRQIFRNLPS